jgi:hypothetical protein
MPTCSLCEYELYCLIEYQEPEDSHRHDGGANDVENDFDALPSLCLPSL